MSFAKIVFSIAALTSSAAFAKCIPANEFVPFEEGPASAKGATFGMYSRVSPDGRFILRSKSGAGLSNVTLMEIVKNADGTKVARVHNTKLHDEAFPVQGSWRFVQDTNAEYYKVGDIVKFGPQAKAKLQKGLFGWYISAAELPGGTEDLFKVRSLSWPGQEGGSLRASVVTAKREGSEYKVADYDDYNMCGNFQWSAEGTAFGTPMLSLDGNEFAGVPINGRNGQTMRIYKIKEDNKSCEKVDDLGYNAAKAIFGYPRDGKKAPLVSVTNSSMLLTQKCDVTDKQWVKDPKDPNKSIQVPLEPPIVNCYYPQAAVSGVHFYDRELKKNFYIGSRYFSAQPDAYPGVTKDGRVIYAAMVTQCHIEKSEIEVTDMKTGEKMKVPKEDKICVNKIGYIITDPYQSEDIKNFQVREPKLAKGNFRSCITEDEVSAVEKEQAPLYQ